MKEDFQCHPLLAHFQHIKRLCLALPSDAPLEELLFRILVHPRKDGLLKKNRDVLQASFSSFPNIEERLQGNGLFCEDLWYKKKALNAPTWFKQTIIRARQWFGCDNTEMLFRVFYVQECAEPWGICLTYRVGQKLDVFPECYSEDFLETYRYAWHCSSRNIRGCGMDWHIAKYNTFTLLGGSAKSVLPVSRVEGRSAFLSFLVPLICMAQQVKLSPRFCFMGALREDTKHVDPVDHVRLKVQAAYEYGMKVVFLHEGNRSEIKEKDFPMEFIFYDHDEPEAVTNGIIERIRSMSERYPGTLSSPHHCVHVDQTINRLGHRLKKCYVDVHSRDRMHTAFNELIEIRDGLEDLGQQGSTAYTDCLLLIQNYYNHIGNQKEATRLREKVTELKDRMSPEQQIRWLNIQSVTHQDSFLIEEADKLLREARRICMITVHEGVPEETDQRLRDLRLEVLRTLAQNCAYARKPHIALSMIARLGKLPTDQRRNRFINYWTHAACDMEDKQAWKSIIQQRPLFNQSCITDDHEGIYDVHAHVKGFLVFENHQRCEDILRTVYDGSSSFSYMIKAPSSDPAMMGIILQCIGMVHERLFLDTESDEHRRHAAHCYEKSYEVRANTGDLINLVLGANALAHYARLLRDNTIAEEARQLLAETTRDYPFYDGREYSLWAAFRKVIEEEDPLSFCMELNRTLKRFQWW